MSFPPTRNRRAVWPSAEQFSLPLATDKSAATTRARGLAAHNALGLQLRLDDTKQADPPFRGSKAVGLYPRGGDIGSLGRNALPLRKPS